jgi:CRP/FNR family transcriptional regulator, anaerobic regulatory protein
MHRIVAQPDVLPQIPVSLQSPFSKGLRTKLRTPRVFPKIIAPRAVIMAEGQGCLYKVLEGCVALYHSMKDGRRQIIDIIGPGRLLGPFIAGNTICTAEALTYTTLERTTESSTQADVAEQIMTSLDRARNHTLLLGRKTADEKVASAMLDLADQFMLVPRVRGRKKNMTFNLYLTRADLGDWLGLTVETVSRCLNALKRDGLIAFEQTGRITILQPERLYQRAAMTDHRAQ